MGNLGNSQTHLHLTDRRVPADIVEISEAFRSARALGNGRVYFEHRAGGHLSLVDLQVSSWDADTRWACGPEGPRGSRASDRAFLEPYLKHAVRGIAREVMASSKHMTFREKDCRHGGPLDRMWGVILPWRRLEKRILNGSKLFREKSSVQWSILIHCPGTLSIKLASTGASFSNCSGDDHGGDI